MSTCTKHDPNGGPGSDQCMNCGEYAEDAVIEVVLHQALRPDFERWLAQRQLQLAKFQEATDDHLVVYIVVPAEAAWLDGRRDGPVGNSGPHHTS